MNLILMVSTYEDLTSPLKVEGRENVSADILNILDELNLNEHDLFHLKELSPYLILDGHRTGIQDHEEHPARGYIEGAKFSLRFARIFQEMGGKETTFLIHTLRNYSTMDRMHSIFDAVGDIGRRFIKKARLADIKLRYYGENVRTTYALAEIINQAELATQDCQSFNLNFLTNYSEEWANANYDQISDLPNISIIGRFTKGHYSGAGIPGHADKSNFVYIQQASVSENWSDEEIIVLILTLLKGHLALKGYVGGKSYGKEERMLIRQRRELELFEENIRLSTHPSKRITSFSPMGPITVYF